MLTRDCHTIFDLLEGSRNTHYSYYWWGLWTSRVRSGVKEFNDTQCHFKVGSLKPGYQVQHLSWRRKELEWPLNAGLPWEWGEGVTEWRWCAFLESVFKWNLWINQSSSFGICNKAILAISLCRTVFFKNGKAFNIVYKITGQPLFRPPHTSLHLPVHSQ